MLLCTRTYTKATTPPFGVYTSGVPWGWTGNRFCFEPININGYLKALLYIHIHPKVNLFHPIPYVSQYRINPIAVRSATVVVASAAAVPVIQSRLPAPATTARRITVAFNCYNNNNYYANVSRNCKRYLYRVYIDPTRRWRLNNTARLKSTVWPMVIDKCVLYNAIIT